MKSAKIPFMILFLGCALVFFGVSLTPPKTVQAQCASPSSCKTCHETNGQDPVNQKDVWHTQHAVFDYCTVCHGGSRDAADKTAAHQGMAVKLSGMTGTCVNCHAKDYQDRLAAYTAVLGVDVDIPTPGALCTPTPDVFGSEQSIVIPAVEQAAVSPSGGTSSGQTRPAANSTGNLILTILLIALVGGGGSYVYFSEKKRKMNPSRVESPGELQPEVATELDAMIPELAKLTPDGLRALRHLIRRPEQASEWFEKMDQEKD
jgi:hypothetical protein